MNGLTDFFAKLLKTPFLARSNMSKKSKKRRQRAAIARANNQRVTEMAHKTTIMTGSQHDNGGPKHAVTVFQDHHLLYPDLFLDVYIHGDAYEQAAFAPMFTRARCKRATSVETADLVVFTGGVDVSPSLYGKGDSVHPRTETPNNARDDEDIRVYLICLAMGIPMLGVCRGAQFLHVMNGGKLFQHLDGHNGDHKMLDLRDRTVIERISSVHHQAVMPNIAGGMEILGTVAMSKERWEDADTKKEGLRPDIEAFFYRDTCCIGIQGHPEYSGYHFFTMWALNLINDCVLLNPDVDWVDKNRRVTPEILKMRDTADYKPERLFKTNQSLRNQVEQETLRLPPPINPKGE